MAAVWAKTQQPSRTAAFLESGLWTAPQQWKGTPIHFQCPLVPVHGQSDMGVGWCLFDGYAREQTSSALHIVAWWCLGIGVVGSAPSRSPKAVIEELHAGAHSTDVSTQWRHRIHIGLKVPFGFFSSPLVRIVVLSVMCHVPVLKLQLARAENIYHTTRI